MPRRIGLRVPRLLGLCSAPGGETDTYAGCGLSRQPAFFLFAGPVGPRSANASPAVQIPGIVRMALAAGGG